MVDTKELFAKRARRNRSSLRRRSPGKIRLSVFRSSKNIYAQLIDDNSGNTLAAASSLDKELRPTLKTGADKAAAEAVGKLLAQRGLDRGLSEVIFDRGGYRFHGRVKALADSARQAGLKF